MRTCHFAKLDHGYHHYFGLRPMAVFTVFWEQGWSPVLPLYFSFMTLLSKLYILCSCIYLDWVLGSVIQFMHNDPKFLGATSTRKAELMPRQFPEPISS